MKKCHCNGKHVCAQNVPLFNHLDYDELVKISEGTRHKKYSKGETVFSPLDDHQLIIVVHGKVKVFRLNANGKEQLLRILNPGDFMGEETLFNIESTTWAEALEEVEICILKQEDFKTILQCYPQISFKLLEEYSRRLHDLESLTMHLSTDTVSVRLCDYLLKLSHLQNSLSLMLPLSMKELAAFLSTTPETLSRTLSDLKKKGIIDKKGKCIMIKSLEQLQKEIKRL